jgi:hypothetical protein
MTILFGLSLVLCILLVTYGVHVMTKRRLTEYHVENQDVSLDTTMVGFNTTPHEKLLKTVVLDDPRESEYRFSYRGDTTLQDAQLVLSYIAKLASGGDGTEDEFVPGQILAHRTVDGSHGITYMYIAALVHTKTITIRFAATVEWDGNPDNIPIVRSMSFDPFNEDLAAIHNESGFVGHDFASVEDYYCK